MKLNVAKTEAAKLTASLRSVRDAPDVVYHYTSPAAFLSIVETQSLWCSNIAYSNDPDETRYAQSLITSAVHELLEPATANFVDLMMPQFSYFGASFSGECDLLQQWRTYCANGRGVAIGVRTAILLTHKDFMFGRVEYDVHEQERLVRQIVQLFAPCFTNAIPRSREFMDAASALGMNLAVLSGMFKSAAYSLEQEYRLFRISTTHTDAEDAQVQFRARGVALIPYRVMRMRDVLSPAKTIPLGEVVVGPCLERETFSTSVRLLLDRYDLHAVAVRSSGVKMRAES